MVGELLARAPSACSRSTRREIPPPAHGIGVARRLRRGDIVEVRRRGIHNETGIGNVFVAETVGELVADFGRGAVAVGAGQGELQIFLGCFVRRICADGASRQHCQHGDGHQQPAELAHQRFCRGTSEYCGHIESFFSAAGQLPNRYGGSSVFFGAVGFFTA